MSVAQHLVVGTAPQTLKRQVPPLGELEIMHAEDYRDFLAFGPMAGIVTRLLT